MKSDREWFLEAHRAIRLERNEKIWREVEGRVHCGRFDGHDSVVSGLQALRYLAERDGELDDFNDRLGDFRQRHASNPVFIQTLDEGGLR